MPGRRSKIKSRLSLSFVYTKGVMCVLSFPGVLPASQDQSKQQGLSEEDDKTSTVFSVGSDALIKSWFQDQPSLDMKMCCSMVCMALAVLLRMKRFHTVVQVMLSAAPVIVPRPLCICVMSPYSPMLVTACCLN